MLEYIVVFVIVAAAAVYAAGKLWRQAGGRSCENCNCPEKGSQNGNLTQLESHRIQKR
jgi:hypothetical protein